MGNYTIKTFLKFGQEEHIKDMFDNGTIYMNSIHYLKNPPNLSIKKNLDSMSIVFQTNHSLYTSVV